MKCFIVLSALVAVALAKPGVLHGLHGYGAVLALLAYAHVVPGAPIGPDGRVVDTPEVAFAKAEHAAAHINEKVTLATEAAKHYGAHYSTLIPSYSGYASSPIVSTYSAPALHTYGKYYSGISPLISAYSGYAPAIAYGHGAPLGLDGRVVDTPEVAIAKAGHFAAHAEANARLGYAGHYGYARPTISLW